MEPGIRPAIPEDLPAMIEMGKAFFEEAGHAGEHPFCEQSFAKTLHLLGSAGLLLVVDNGTEVVGMAAADIAPAYWNHAIKIGREAFFYVKPKHRTGLGKLLIKALEDVSLAHGATVFDLVAESGPRRAQALTRGEALGRLYTAHGYALAERTFRKVLQPCP